MFRISETAAQAKLSLEPNLVEAAMKWYKSFIVIMKKEGIDVDNPYALGMVSILYDVVPGYSNCTKDELRFAMLDALQNCPLAFMETDEKGHYIRPQADNEPSAEWIIRNMKRVTGITIGHMVKLYKAAEENRLVLRKCDPTGMEDVSCKYFRVLNGGDCGITRCYVPLVGDEAEDLLLTDDYSEEQVAAMLARGRLLEMKAAELREIASNEVPEYIKYHSDYDFMESRSDAQKAKMPLVHSAVCAIGKLDPSKMLDKGERTAISWQLAGQLC